MCWPTEYVCKHFKLTLCIVLNVRLASRMGQIKEWSSTTTYWTNVEWWQNYSNKMQRQQRCRKGCRGGLILWFFKNFKRSQLTTHYLNSQWITSHTLSFEGIPQTHRKSITDVHVKTSFSAIPTDVRSYHRCDFYFIPQQLYWRPIALVQWKSVENDRLHSQMYSLGGSAVWRRYILLLLSVLCFNLI